METPPIFQYCQSFGSECYCKVREILFAIQSRGYFLYVPMYQITSSPLSVLGKAASFFCVNLFQVSARNFWFSNLSSPLSQNGHWHMRNSGDAWHGWVGVSPGTCSLLCWCPPPDHWLNPCVPGQWYLLSVVGLTLSWMFVDMHCQFLWPLCAFLLSARAITLCWLLVLIAVQIPCSWLWRPLVGRWSWCTVVLGCSHCHEHLSG